MARPQAREQKMKWRERGGMERIMIRGMAGLVILLWWLAWAITQPAAPPTP